MKQFFEQYGAVALGILALLVLIAMITPVGNIIKTSLQGTVQTFSAKMDGQVDSMTESMNAAFTNATGFTGVKNHTYYFNGQVHPTFVENELVLSDDGYAVTGKDGLYINYIALDANVYYQGNNYGGGITDLRFDAYIDGTLNQTNVKDWNWGITLNSDHDIKIVVKQTPNGVKTSQAEYNYKMSDLTRVFIGTGNHALYFEVPIYAYDA